MACGCGKVTSNYCSSSTVHGLPHIASSRNCCKKLIWTIIVICAVGLLAYQVYQVLTEYFRYPKIVTIEVTNPQAVQFPAVTVCSLHILNASRMRNEGNVTGAFKDLLQIVPLPPINNASKKVNKRVARSLEKMISSTREEHFSNVLNINKGVLPLSFPGIQLQNMSIENSRVLEHMYNSYGKNLTQYYKLGKDIYNLLLLSIIELFTPAEDDENAILENILKDLTPLHDLHRLTDNIVDSLDCSWKEGSDKRISYTCDNYPSSIDEIVKNDSPNSVDVALFLKYLKLVKLLNNNTKNDADNKNFVLNERASLFGRQNVNHRLQKRSSKNKSTGLGLPGLDSLMPNGINNLIANSLTEITNKMMGNLTNLLNNKVMEQVKSQMNSVTSKLYGDVLSKITDSAVFTQLSNAIMPLIMAQVSKLLADSGLGNLVGNLLNSQLVDALTKILASVPNLLSSVLEKSISREDFQKFGILAEHFILKCKFDKENCSFKNFSTHQNEKYGNCFTFIADSLNSSRVTRKFGSGYGLHLLLKITNKEEDIPIYSANNGVRVVVHSQQDWAYVQDHGLEVPPKMSASVAIAKKKLDRILPPYGDCVNDSSVYGWANISKGLPYSRKGCLTACKTEAILLKCQCVLNMRLGGHLDNKARQCNIDTAYPGNKDIQCIEGILKEDLCKCGPACNEEQWNSGISYSVMNEGYLCASEMIGLNGPPSTAMCTQDPSVLVELKVYLSDLSYETITESKLYTLTSLLSNVGGTLGLCMGLSVISIIELIELFFDLLFVCCCCCCVTTPSTTPVKPLNVKQNEKQHTNGVSTINVAPHSIP